MSTTEKILVVIDPGKEQHQALQRAVVIAQNSAENVKTELIILLAVNSEAYQGREKEAEVVRDGLWVLSLLDDIEATGMVQRVLISWGGDWAQTILNVVEENDIDLCMIPYYGHSGAHLWGDQRWKLLRQSEQPVLMISNQVRGKLRKILLTIKDQDPAYEERNAKVIAMGKHIASNFGGELHVVNAYNDQLDYPDRSRIIQQTAVDNDRIHVKLGKPEDVVCEVANQIDADIVLISSGRRQGLAASLRGNTVESIVAKISRDVLMI